MRTLNGLNQAGPPTPELPFVTFDCKASAWQAYAEFERGRRSALARADGEHDNDDCVGQDDARA